MVVEPSGIYYDGFLHKQLSFVRDKVIKRDFDFIALIDGYPGTGKSTLAMQLCYLLDPTFNLSRVCFRADEFTEAVVESQPYTCIMLDEAAASVSSTDATSKMSKALLKMLAEIRQKNLMIFFCCPTYFDLNKGISIFRTKILLHVHLGKAMTRGFYKIYTEHQKKVMYVLGKKEYDYRKGGKTYCGRFTNKMPPTINEDEYRLKKKEAFMWYVEQGEDKDTTTERERAYKWMRDELIWLIMQEHAFNPADTCQFVRQMVPHYPFDDELIRTAIRERKTKEQGGIDPIVFSKRKAKTVNLLANQAQQPPSKIN